MLHKFKYNVKNSKLLFGGVAKCNKNDNNIKTNARSYFKFRSMRLKLKTCWMLELSRLESASLRCQGG